MNTTNPMDFLGPLKPEPWTANAPSHARTMLAELEKQTVRWAEYGASQAVETQRLAMALQTQAFGVTKSMLDTTEKAFSKTSV
ncbi:MAG: hypothetical protein ABI321_03950 [Polyangia bacterium]